MSSNGGETASGSSDYEAKKGDRMKKLRELHMRRVSLSVQVVNHFHTEAVLKINSCL